jgi:hypothetical protein
MAWEVEHLPLLRDVVGSIFNNTHTHTQKIPLTK